MKLFSKNSEKILSKEEFKTYFLDYFAALVRFAESFGLRSDESEDLVSEIFIGIWKNRKHTPLQRPLKAYLFKAVKNRSINMLRLASRKTEVSKETVHVLELSNEDSYSFEAVDSEKLLDMLMAELNPVQKRIFRLAKLEGFTAQEIADILQMNKKTVYNLLGISVKAIQEKYIEYQRSITT